MKQPEIPFPPSVASADGAGTGAAGGVTTVSTGDPEKDKKLRNLRKVKVFFVITCDIPPVPSVSHAGRL